ncbi:hypothetical protein WMY93_018964 [Mugilogobius chulae]|uniref:Uncharacterized protein n=1 Tax=Mugilogobius chulae TaxID=88201 RepID=A0AAW0NK98_9GOBI
MLLRTLLLFLCVSSSLCATLGLFMQEKDEDTPAQEPPVLDNVVEAVEGNIQDTKEAIADEITKDASPPAEEKGLLKKLFVNDKQSEELEVDKEVQEVNITLEDVAATEEVVTENDRKDTEEVDVIQDQLSQKEEDNEIKPVQTEEVPKKPEEQNSRWSLSSIRSSFQNMNGYFDSLVELVGGRNGVCQRTSEPSSRIPDPEPNGCSSSLVGFQLDLGIPAMTQCCNQLDSCYDTCGTSKYDCDSSFRTVSTVSAQT